MQECRLPFTFCKGTNLCSHFSFAKPQNGPKMVLRELTLVPCAPVTRDQHSVLLFCDSMTELNKSTAGFSWQYARTDSWGLNPLFQSITSNKKSWVLLHTSPVCTEQPVCTGPAADVMDCAIQNLSAASFFVFKSIAVIKSTRWMVLLTWKDYTTACSYHCAVEIPCADTRGPEHGTVMLNSDQGQI